MIFDADYLGFFQGIADKAYCMSVLGRPSITDLNRSNLEKAKIEIMPAPGRLIEGTDKEDCGVDTFDSTHDEI